jgi:hypothetical protein
MKGTCTLEVCCTTAATWTNKCKVLLDALRMPMGPRDLPAAASHDRPVFFCVLEDDRLVSRITLEVRNRLGPRPKRRDMTTLEVDIDVKNVRDALARTLSPYLNGQGTLLQAIDNLVQALSPGAR